MPSPAWEDLDVFFDTAEFAVSATITPRQGEPRTLRAIFDDPYVNAELGDHDVDTQAPRLTCKEVDVAVLKKGDTVAVVGRTFRLLSGPQPDGTGLAVLRLAEQ